MNFGGCKNIVLVRKFVPCGPKTVNHFLVVLRKQFLVADIMMLLDATEDILKLLESFRNLHEVKVLQKLPALVSFKIPSVVLGSLYPEHVDSLEDLRVSFHELLENMVDSVEGMRRNCLADRVVLISVDQWFILTVHMFFEICTVSLLVS